MQRMENVIEWFSEAHKVSLDRQYSVNEREQTLPSDSS